MLQAKSQLKAIYKDNADTIVGNMDSQIFLGGSEPTTLKELNAALGKETIDMFNTSDTRGNSRHTAQIIKRPVMISLPSMSLPYWTAASASFSCAVSDHFCLINMI